MRISFYYQHFTLKKWLAAYTDNHLTANLYKKVGGHVAECFKCQNTIKEIQNCRELIQSSTIGIKPASSDIWRRIESEIQKPETHQIHGPRFSFPQKRNLKWIMAAASFISVGFLLNIYFGNGNSSLETPRNQTQFASAFDFGFYIDLKENEQDVEAFYELYEAKEFIEDKSVSFNVKSLAMTNHLKAELNPDCVRLLRNGLTECTGASCKIDKKIIEVFQLNLGQPISFGNHVFRRVNFDGVECLLLEKEGFYVINWRGSLNEYLAIGDLSEKDILKLVQTLL